MKRKGILTFFILIISIGLLAGCSGSAYSQHMKVGNDAMTKKDYNVAISEFAAALKEKNTDTTAQSQLIAARDGKYHSLYDPGKKAYDSKNYELAVKYFQQAYEFDKTKDSTLKDQLETAKKALQAEKVITDYYKWINDTAKQTYDLQTQWRTASDAFSIGSITRDEFGQKMEAMITPSNNILTSSENKIFELNPDLAQIHQPLIDQLKANHNLILQIIVEAKDPTQNPLQIVTSGKNLANYQELFADLTQSLQQYASSQGVKLE